MPLLQDIALLLIAAHLLGRLATHVGQPALLGHMVAGVLLGPALLNWVAADPLLNSIADAAVLLVVISAGLEMRLSEVSSYFKGPSLLALLPGVLLPAFSGLAVAFIFGYELLAATVVALCVAVTALPVALRILASFGLLNTSLARLTVAGALLADVTVLIILGTLASAAKMPELTVTIQVGQAGLKLVALLLLVGFSMWLTKRLYRRFAQHAQRVALEIAYALILILSLAAATRALGLHFAIGTFLGALIVAESHLGLTPHPLRRPLEGVTNLLCAPLFLACQGTHFTTSSLANPSFVACLVLVAVISKMVGGYWGARRLGLPRHEAQGAAIVMNARGLMEMVVASIAYRAGLVDQDLYSTLLIVGIVTTLLTPLLLKVWQRQVGAVLAE